MVERAFSASVRALYIFGCTHSFRLEAELNETVTVGDRLQQELLWGGSSLLVQGANHAKASKPGAALCHSAPNDQRDSVSQFVPCQDV